jgi:hypothetical protein
MKFQFSGFASFRGETPQTGYFKNEVHERSVCQFDNCIPHQFGPFSQSKIGDPHMLPSRQTYPEIHVKRSNRNALENSG